MLTNDGISVGDALALRGYNDNDGFGGNNSWWIVLLVLLFAGGWNNGFGFGGNNSNPCCTPATSQGLSDAFNFNQLDNGLRGIQSSMSSDFCSTQAQLANGFASVGRDMLAGFDGTNLALTSAFDGTNLAITTGFDGVQQAITRCCCDMDSKISGLGYQIQQGINGIDKSLMQNAFQAQAGFNNLATAQAADTCTLSRGQDIIRNEIAQAARDINIVSEKNTDRILDYLTQTEMDKLRSELQNAQFQISQQAQTSDIVNSLMPVAKPAYLTCSPYASAFGFNNGCGCGCSN